MLETKKLKTNKRSWWKIFHTIWKILIASDILKGNQNILVLVLTRARFRGGDDKSSWNNFETFNSIYICRPEYKKSAESRKGFKIAKSCLENDFYKGQSEVIKRFSVSNWK